MLKYDNRFGQRQPGETRESFDQVLINLGLDIRRLYF